MAGLDDLRYPLDERGLVIGGALVDEARREERERWRVERAQRYALLDHRLADWLGAEERLDLPVRDGLEARPLGLEHHDLRIVHCERELHTGDHEFPLRYASCVQLARNRPPSPTVRPRPGSANRP